MYKKIIALTALLTNIAYISAAQPGSPATWGYQAKQEPQAEHHHKHHHKGLTPEKKTIVDNYEKEIQEMQKELVDPHWKSRYCWLTFAGSTITYAIDKLAGDSDKEKGTRKGTRLGETAGGLAIVALVGGIGTYIIETMKVAETEERIRDRRDRQEKIIS